MRAFFTMWRKEWQGYFLSPIAYAVLVVFLAAMGHVFWFLCSALADGAPGITVMGLFFASPFFWMVLLFMVPVLTMRTLAEEKRSGTIETLLCAPVSDAAVVLAKFAGVLSFYVVMWLPTLGYLGVLSYFQAATAPVEWGSVAGGYLGALLIGCFYLSVGIFCSALTSNQVIAGFICFSALLTLFLAGFLDALGRQDWTREVGLYISSYQHLVDFSRGVFDTRPVVFHVSGTIVCLFAATRVLESRQWK